MKCPNGHEVNSQVKFCPICGADLRGTRYCPDCGYERNGDEKVCPQCGSTFDTQDTYDFDIDDKAESDKSLLIILSIIAIAIIGVGCWLYISKEDSKNAVSTSNNSTKTVQEVDSIEEVVDSVIATSESYYSESSSNDYNSTSNDYNSSSTNSDYYDESSSKKFLNAQYVVGYLANQSFRASDGLTMRVDGDGRLYVDGDYAGVLSVLRYTSTSALLRYGGGMYGEGKLTVNIVGDKFTLTDPTDGTVYYQR